MTTEDRINILLNEALVTLHAQPAYQRLGFKYHQEIAICITLSEETFQKMAYDVPVISWSFNGYFFPTCSMLLAVLAYELQAAGPMQIIHNSATLNALLMGAGPNASLGSYPVMKDNNLQLGKAKIKVWDKVKQVWL